MGKSLEERVEWLEGHIEQLSETLIDAVEEVNKYEKKLKDLSIKFNAFSLAVLGNSDKELSKKVFKEYQKRIFKSNGK